MSLRRELPAKLYFRIGEVAGIVGVEPHVLRYWETEFRSVKPQKSAKGQRIYSRRDVETLLKVRELLYAHKFTIAGAKKKLREGGIEPPPPDAAVNSEEAQRLRDALTTIRGELLSLMEELDRQSSESASRTSSDRTSSESASRTSSDQHSSKPAARSSADRR